jgi:glutamate carboxypeptidase
MPAERPFQREETPVDSNTPGALDRWCRERLPEMLATLEAIVNIDSCSPNPAGVERVADLLDERLMAAGFGTERVAPPLADVPDWLAEFFLPEIGSFERVARHLIGRRAGNGNGHGLLIGHTDTAFPPGEPERNPFRIEGERAVGCSIADMKAGLVVLLYAATALSALQLDSPRITVLYDSDEQAGSVTARPLIERLVREERVTAAIVAEMGLAGGALRNRRPALGIARVDVRGIERHVGTGYWEGASAVAALSRKVAAFEALSDRERALVVNVGEIGGGSRRNLVPGHAWAKLDLRAPTQPEWEALAGEVRAIAEREDLPGTTSTCRIYNHRPAMVPTDATAPLLATVERAGDLLGRRVWYVESSGGLGCQLPGRPRHPHPRRLRPQQRQHHDQR